MEVFLHGGGAQQATGPSECLLWLLVQTSGQECCGQIEEQLSCAPGRVAVTATLREAPRSLMGCV